MALRLLPTELNERPGASVPSSWVLAIRLLVDFPGLEIEELRVARVLQHQRLLAVANDHPVALPDLQLLDMHTSCASQHFVMAQRDRLHA